MWLLVRAARVSGMGGPSQLSAPAPSTSPLTTTHQALGVEVISAYLPAIYEKLGRPTAGAAITPEATAALLGCGLSPTPTPGFMLCNGYAQGKPPPSPSAIAYFLYTLLSFGLSANGLAVIDRALHWQGATSLPYRLLIGAQVLLVGALNRLWLRLRGAFLIYPGNMLYTWA